MEQIRSFIAIELPRELKLELGRLEDELASGSRAPVKWVDPANMHITLKFLGDISPGMTGRITSVIEEAAREIQPFHLEAGGLGVFPNPRRVQVVWVGLDGETDRLNRLQKGIESGLVPLGFRAESRPFTPHLTLARVRERAMPDERQALGQLIESTGFTAECKFQVDYVHLMRSQLTREGPIYSRIGSVLLK
jgi:2'-5' RNA ligase